MLKLLQVNRCLIWYVDLLQLETDSIIYLSDNQLINIAQSNILKYTSLHLRYVVTLHVVYQRECYVPKLLTKTITNSEYRAVDKLGLTSIGNVGIHSFICQSLVSS